MGVLAGLCFLLGACIAADRRASVDAADGTDGMPETASPPDGVAEIEGDSDRVDTLDDTMPEGDGLDTATGADTDATVDTTPVGFVRIPAGTFVMGSPPEEEGRQQGEVQRQVTVSAFYLQTTEVTQAQWFVVFGTNPSHFVSANGYVEDVGRPVDSVNWFSAAAYMNALSRRDGLTECYDLTSCTGKDGRGDLACSDLDLAFKGLGCSGYRFPTAAEWEYAARGGTEGAHYHLPGALADVAWYAGNSGDKTHAVAAHALGAEAANNYGLYDMLGNALEWVGDWFGTYGTESVSDPVGPSSRIGDLREARGGYFTADGGSVRAASRFAASPSTQSSSNGLRPARSIHQSP